jgi:FkbM family methyltransferase
MRSPRHPEGIHHLRRVSDASICPAPSQARNGMRRNKEPSWEDRFARASLLPALRGFVSSLTRVKPLEGELEYYRALLLSFVLTIVRRKPQHPGIFLRRSVWVRYLGFDYLMDSNTVFGYYLHTFEPRTAELLLGSGGGDVFIDVGANVGQYCIPLSRQFRRVIAVEPNPTALEVLRQNLRRNGIVNIEIVPLAVAQKKGRVMLRRGGFLTTWSIRRPGEAGVEVASVPLDDVMKDIEKVDLLKVDIEGAENDVLMSSSCLDKVRTLSVSVTHTSMREILPRLETAGFRMTVPSSAWGLEENAYGVNTKWD